MGLFQNNKKTPLDEEAERVLRFFDDHFREELRERAREYFEEVIKDNGAIFKQDLDTSITQINLELKGHITTHLDTAITEVTGQLQQHITEKLDGQFIEYSRVAKEAQEDSMATLTKTTQDLQSQYQQLIRSLQTSVAELQQNIVAQQKALDDMLSESKAQVATMKDAEASTLRWLNDSAQAMHEQHKQLSETLGKSVATQENVLVGAFEQNMARVIEHYLLGAIGEQYDLKAQLPAIVAQMEANKQAIVEDVKL